MKRRVFIGGLVILLIVIIFLLVWFVLKGGVASKFFTGRVIQSRCSDITINPIKVTNLTAGNFSVIIFREGGSENISGVKLIFSDENWSQNSTAYVPENITAFQNISVLVVNVGIPNPRKLIAAAYFSDEEGNEHICKNSEVLKF